MSFNDFRRRCELGLDRRGVLGRSDLGAGRANLAGFMGSRFRMGVVAGDAVPKDEYD